MSWCWGHRGEQHKRLFRELSLPRASWCGWRRTLELLQPSPGWVSPPVAARESVPSEGGRELSLQDGSARPTAALAGRRQACGRRERQGAGARLGVPDGGGRRGWGRGDRGTLWLQIRGGGESGREAGRRLPATTPISSPRRSVHPAGRAPAVRGTRMTAPRPLAAQVRAPIPGALPLAATAVGSPARVRAAAAPGSGIQRRAAPRAARNRAERVGGNRAPPARGEAKSGGPAGA